MSPGLGLTHRYPLHGTCSCFCSPVYYWRSANTLSASVQPLLLECGRPSEPFSYHVAQRNLQISAARAQQRHPKEICESIIDMKSIFKTETVTFTNSAGLQLQGTLQLVESNEVVILCHGLADHRDSFVYPELANVLAASGISTLRFDFCGNGMSDGIFKYANFREEVEDVRAAVEFLKRKGLEVVALVGHSKGAATVLLYHAKFNDIRKVAAVAPRFNQQEGALQCSYIISSCTCAQACCLVF
eukprot:jgi/Botrbrau1/19825/Bobra.0124s0066.1